jgi:hypothetical protein
MLSLESRRVGNYETMDCVEVEEKKGRTLQALVFTLLLGAGV